jgi:hypothetical protein
MRSEPKQHTARQVGAASAGSAAENRDSEEVLAVSGLSSLFSNPPLALPPENIKPANS